MPVSYSQLYYLSGKNIKLLSFRHNHLIYACGFSDRYPQFTEKGAVILGVSKDSVASHKRFEEKYGLAFTLLADPERKVIEAYDVWKEKKNYGKVSMGVVRTTYLIDEQGIIIKANDKVKAADDPENMLKELD